MERLLCPPGGCRATHPAGGATSCCGRPGATPPPPHRVPGGDRGGHHRLALYPDGASARARHSPTGGPLPERGVDGHRGGVGDAPGGGACATDKRLVCAPLAARNLCSGREHPSGLGCVAHAQRCSHANTLVSGVRGGGVRAPGLPSSVTDARQRAPQTPWGSVSSASPSTPARRDLLGA